MPDTADRDLMVAAIAGDPAAFGSIVRIYAGPLLRFVGRFTSDGHAAEDIVQDSLLAAWRRRDQFDPGRPFKAWLYRIALNRCRELHRKSSPTILPESIEQISPSNDSPFAAAVAVETVATVLSAVDRLPTAQRAVVLMRVWEGLSYADIAFALGVNDGTARSHMHHALQSLRASLRQLE